MLFAGFIGGACWSIKHLPTPYPVPFGEERIKPSERWFLVTTIQSHLQARALLMGTLLDAYRLRLSVITPFHPALLR
jgi:hypothetical protein